MRIKRELRDFIYSLDNKPTANCHASTIVRLESGTLVASWFGGTKEGNDDVAIWVSRRENGVWCNPICAAEKDGEPQWNPVLSLRKDGTLVLFYKTGRPISQWYTMVCYSADGGRTWFGHKELVPGDRGGRGPVKNKAVLLSNGILLAPASVEGETWDAFADLSYDEGETWTTSAMVPMGTRGEHGNIFDPTHCTGKGVIQPSVWESKPGHVHMLLRSTGSRIFRTDSTDNGKTWCAAYATGMPNNNSGLDLVKLDNGVLFLCCNPVGTPPGQWGGLRTPIVLMVSYDNGVTWEPFYLAENIEGEFSYPAIIAKGNTLYITYTWKRETIRFIELELE